MSDALGHEDLVRMLRRVSALVRAEHETLTRLDSQGGDGDHGTTMVRAMDQLERALDESPPDDLPGLLEAVGWAIMGVDGGATGPLLGSLFMGLGSAAKDVVLDAQGLATAFTAGLEAVQKNTRARVGDKTLMDALIPAVEALRESASEDTEPARALGRAADAARLGAESTRDLQARFGRAKNLGEGSRGHRDPGATSMALVFKGLEQGARRDG